MIPPVGLHPIPTGGEAGYPQVMNATLNPFQTDIVRFGLCMVVLAILTGCVGYVEGPGAGVYADSGTFAAQDNYVYYPQYECYYSVSRHQYAYRDGNVWVAQPVPRGVSVNVLVASPSVKMSFHDSPAQHYAAVVKQYPKDWKSFAGNQGQNQKDDHQRDNNG
jgi:hypothetical protein